MKLKSKYSLLEPLLTTWGRAHEESAPWMWKPISSFNKVQKISEDSLDSILSPSPSVKIQIIGRKVYLS